MNREDRTKFLTLIEEHNASLLVGIDRDHVSDEAIMDLVAHAMTPPPTAVAVRPAAHGPQLSAAALDALCAQHGLTYRTSERVTETRPDGTTHRVWVPRGRPLTAADILSHRLHGTQVTVVTADGQKQTLVRAGEAA